MGQKHKTVQFSSQASSRLQSPQSSRVHAEVPLLPLHVVEEFETLPKRRNSESHVPTLFPPATLALNFQPLCQSVPLFPSAVKVLKMILTSNAPPHVSTSMIFILVAPSTVVVTHSRIFTYRYSQTRRLGLKACETRTFDPAQN